MKKLLFVIFLCAVLLSGAVLVNAESTEVQAAALSEPVIEQASVKIDGKPLSSEYATFIRNDVTLVPLRAVLESLGCTVKWNGEEKPIEIEKGNTKISLTINSPEITVNGEKKTMPSETLLIGEITYIPIRAISEALKYIVGWDEERNIAGIFTYGEMNSVTVGDYYVCLGQKVGELKMLCGEPSYKIIGDKGLEWYIYAKYSTALIAVAVDGGVVCGFYTDSPHFKTSDGYKYGTPSSDTAGEYDTVKLENVTVSLFNDTVDGYLYGIMYTVDGFENEYDINKALENQCKLGVDILNGFRYNTKELPVVALDGFAVISCTKHSAFMAETAAISHTGKDGSTGMDRYLAENPDYDWTSWGENISAGAKNIFVLMNGWRNSERHRSLMLSDKTLAGIGMAYMPESAYPYTAAMIMIK